MKLLNFFSSVFFLFFIYTFSNSLYSANKANLYNSGVYLDSLFANKKLITSAKRKIKNFKENRLDEKLTSEKLKDIAFSYTVIKDDINSAKYTELYIKKSNDINVLRSSVYQIIGNSIYITALKNKYLPKINFFILFFFGTSIIGLFVFVVLNLRNKGDRVANFLISVFVLLHSLFIINLCLFLSNYVFEFPEVFAISLSFSFLYGPLIYLYFRRLTGKNKMMKIDFLHFTPTLILVLYLSTYYFMTPEEKLHILINRDSLFYNKLVVFILLKSISLFIYSLLIYKLYVKNKEEKNNVTVIKWKKNLTFLSMVYSCVYLVYGFFLIFKLPYTFIYPQAFFLSGIVLYLASSAYIQPKLFSEEYGVDNFDVKYLKSGLTKSFSEELKKQLLALLNEDRIYKDSSLSLASLSEKLNTTRHNVSQIINEHFDVNFFGLLNQYRINEAIEIFERDLSNDLKIIDVAYEVGFNNKVTFNKAFKSQTTLTPSQFIQSLRKAKMISLR